MLIIKKTYLLFIPILFIAEITRSQTNTINGVVVNSVTNTIIPFVNISILGSYKGSVSNSAGEFVLNIPSFYSDRPIKFSCIGYETYELKPTYNVNPIIVRLSPLTHEIEEIAVMPDSTLRNLIRKACQKIPDNYPNFSTRSIGFYRDAMKEINGDYHVLTEAMLEVYKTSYKNKTTGQIKIDKSRKYISSRADSVNNVYFFGGHFIPHTSDLVKRRHPIVQASIFYHYTIFGHTKIDDRDLYIIHFEPTNNKNEGIIGEMYIDKANLAFVKFEYRSNEEQLKNRENEAFAKLSSKEANRVVLYNQTNEKYYLKAASFIEKFENYETGCILEHFLEYTHIETIPGKSKPIPYNKISDYKTIVSQEALPYHASDFHDYPIVHIDEHKLMSRNVSDSIFRNNTRTNKEAPEENKKVKRLSKMLSKFERFGFEYNIQHQTLHIKSGNYKLYFPDMIPLVSHNFDAFNSIWKYETQFSYKLSKQMEISYAAIGNLNEGYHSEAHNLHFTLIVPMKTYGTKYFITFQPGYKIQNTMLSLGETNSMIRFEKSGLIKLDGKSEVYWGERSKGFDGRVSFRHQITRHLWLTAFAGYDYPFKTNPILRFEERNGNSIKRKNIGLHDSGLYLNVNDSPINQPKFELSPFYWGFGIVMSL